MARAKTYQQYEEEERDRRYGFTPDSNKEFDHIHDSFFGSYGNKLRVIDAIVDNSCEGSCSINDGQRMVNDLFSRRDEMGSAEYKAAVDTLACYLQNNLEYGVANYVYHNFVTDERCQSK